MSRKVFTGNEGVRDVIDGKLIYSLIFRANVRNQAVTIATSATPIPETPLSRRMSLVVFNNSAVPVYIGASDVTVETGFPIYPRSSIDIKMEEEVELYGIVSTGTADLRILEGA